MSEFFHEFMRLAGPEEPKTRTNYEANFRNHVDPVLGSRAIRDVDVEAVAELLATIRAKWRRSRGDGKATVRQIHALIRRIFNVAVKLGRLPRYFPNPAAAIEVPNPEPRGVRPLDAWEVEAIVGAIRPMYRPLVYVMGYSGLRIGEASALQWKHLDLDGGWVHVRRAYKESGGELYLGTPKDDDIRTCHCFPASWTRSGSIGRRSRR
ncbi:MAG TPA: hypothetical protein VEQ37_05265 [Actinomycetota bacterium]|nr:hypothetical protein [Actinomycetota bacterium]